MNYRNFGKESIKISEVGLGTWQIGPDWDKGAGIGNAQDIFAAAYDAGVNFFDTADVYGGGRSEEEVGKFIKNHKDIFVATKIGRSGDPGWPANFELSTMRSHVENCLSRLGIEALDLVQLHCIPTEEFAKGQVFENLRILKNEGKIKRFGASVESMEEAQICMKNDDLSSLQIIFNIFRQKPIEEIFDKAKGRGVAIIVRLPLASGLLTGKFTKDTQFSENDHRNYNQNGEKFNVGETFAGLPFEKGVELAEELKSMVPAGLTLVEMALRFILDFDAVTSIIPGASRPDQPMRNAKVSSLKPLSPELHKKLAEFYNSKVKEYIRGKY